MEASQETTSFGFETVNVDEKQGLVRGVFDAVADKYDLMNDLMSAGLHRVWKQRLIDTLHIRPHASQPLRMVDLAGGTGDIAFRACQRAEKRGSQMHVQVIDANEQMVGVGQKRARKSGFEGVDFVTGTAEAVPLVDQSVDYVTIAFGIRNVTHRDRALAEAYRVLKPGGRFVCLEFSHIPSATAQKLYDAYSFNVIPPMGKAITGDASAYQYLIESIRQFPKAGAFQDEVAAAGFSRCQFQRLSGGIAALHTGWRI
jgi:demethylmenaquinone methyltransferase/2-methoxy-6-polyprenyl-1,4-benzoquinol methylase